MTEFFAIRKFFIKPWRCG